MNVKQKTAYVAAAAILAGGLAFGTTLAVVSNTVVAATQAQAYYGNSVTNRSVGWVHIQLEGGRYAWLAGFGSHANDVRWLIVDQGSCVSMGTHVYCAPYGTVSVRVPLGQITVNRIS